MKRRFRERSWTYFTRWCTKRGLRALPAHPWTVAAYLRWLEPRHDLDTIYDRLDVITRAHLHRAVMTPDRHPIVTKTLDLIRRKRDARPNHAALFAPDLVEREVSDGTVPEEPMPGRRSLAMTPKLVRRRPGTDA